MWAGLPWKAYTSLLVLQYWECVRAYDPRPTRTLTWNGFWAVRPSAAARKISRFRITDSFCKSLDLPPADDK